MWTPPSPTASPGRSPRGPGRPAPGRGGKAAGVIMVEGCLGKRSEWPPGGCPLSGGHKVPTSQSRGRHCLPSQLPLLFGQKQHNLRGRQGWRSRKTWKNEQTYRTQMIRPCRVCTSSWVPMRLFITSVDPQSGISSHRGLKLWPVFLSREGFRNVDDNKILPLCHSEELGSWPKPILCDKSIIW